MKIDLIYPKIPESCDKFKGKCIAFEKYDGTNLHWVWSIDDGWHKFGTRRTQFPLTKNGIADFSKEHPGVEMAPHLFNDSLRDRLTVFLSRNEMYSLRTITVFTEFYGPHSFAGNHSPEDAAAGTQQLVLIDVAINNQIIGANIFVDDFEPFNIARLVYQGKYTGQFTEDVRKGKYDVNEGVVCKGISYGQVFMTKVKTNEYLKRLKQR
jgi:hypothetical protein